MRQSSYLEGIVLGLCFYFLSQFVAEIYNEWFAMFYFATCIMGWCSIRLLATLYAHKRRRRELNSFYGIDPSLKLEFFTNPYDSDNPWKDFDSGLREYDAKKAKRTFKRTRELIEK